MSLNKSLSKFHARAPRQGHSYITFHNSFSFACTFPLHFDRKVSLHFLHALRHPSFDSFLTEPVPTQRIPVTRVETNHFPIGQDQTFSKGKLRG